MLDGGTEFSFIDEATIAGNVALDPKEICILEMQWDPHEDNLLVSFGDKSMTLITF